MAMESIPNELAFGIRICIVSRDSQIAVPSCLSLQTATAVVAADTVTVSQSDGDGGLRL